MEKGYLSGNASGIVGALNEVWKRQFIGGRPETNTWRTMKQIPARTLKSDAMSQDLRRRGFSFAGSTICYAFMQAVGMENDHIVGCFRYAVIRKVSSSE